MCKYPWKKRKLRNERNIRNGKACNVEAELEGKISEIKCRIRRRAELEKISFERYLTDAEVKELRKLDYLAKVDAEMWMIEREMREESEKYAQYVHDVPEWAKK